MKAGLFIAAAVVVVVVLVVGVLAAGWVIAGRRVWALSDSPMGAGMTGRWGGAAQPCAGTTQGCGAGGYGLYGGGSAGGAELTIDEAHEAVERYLDGLRYRGLEIAELMEFERNFYAIVREADTGIGAMELLVDKTTGGVGPEMGPNMMWNERYGMHSQGMMGRASEVNTVAPEEALTIASRWLDSNRPTVTVEEHADPFYGYYTIHTLENGEIEGMLSVHGTTGQVWYHNWHGAFVQMIGEEDTH
jgi:hypothetical protein